MTRSSPSEGGGTELGDTGRPTDVVWSLTDLYRSIEDPGITHDLNEFDERGIQLEAWIKCLTQQGDRSFVSAPLTRQLLREYDAICRLKLRLDGYANLKLAEDLQDITTRSFHHRIGVRVSAVESRLIGFRELFQREPDEWANALLQHSDMRPWQYWLCGLRSSNRFRLSAELEKLLIDKDRTSGAAWKRLYDHQISTVQVHFGDASLGIDTAIARLSSSDRSERLAVGQAIADSLADRAPLFATVLSEHVLDRAIEGRWRRHPSAMMPRLLEYRVDERWIQWLAEEVKNAYPTLAHRYYRIKARWLGLDDFDFFDRNAPIPDLSGPGFGWATCRALVLRAFERFSPKLYQVALLFFENAWIDAGPRAGKAPGAFCHPGAPPGHPFILLNHADTLYDLLTLAHELGHGVHALLSAHHGPTLSQAPVFLAETVAVFCELLVIEELVRIADGQRRRTAGRALRIEFLLNLLVRQIALHEFEGQLNSAGADTEQSAEHISAAWLSSLSASLGPGVHIGPQHQHLWCAISHFIHAPFYLCTYAIAASLAVHMHAEHHRNPVTFAGRFIELLEAGGSVDPRELFGNMGIDTDAPDTWAGTVHGIAREIFELDD